MKLFFDRDYPVTSSLLSLSTILFVVMLFLYGFAYSSAYAIYEFGAVYGVMLRLDVTQLWRLVSAIFVHIGFEHFAMNMVTLYFIGRQAEDIFGSRNFFFLYLLSGIMGNIFVLFFTPNAIAAGASTALFGIFGAIIILRYAVRNSYIQQLGQSYLLLLVINLLFSLAPGVSLAGHTGGAVGGALCAIIFPIRGESNAYQMSQRVLAGVAYAILLLLLLFLSLR